MMIIIRLSLLLALPSLITVSSLSLIRPSRIIPRSVRTDIVRTNTSDNHLRLPGTLGREEKECYGALSPTILPSCLNMLENLPGGLELRTWGRGAEDDLRLPLVWHSGKNSSLDIYHIRKRAKLID